MIPTKPYKFGSGSAVARLLRAVGLLSILLAAFPAQASYVIHTGDVLEFAIIGMPETRQRVIVDLEGEVSLALVGTIKASGLTMPDLRARVIEALSTKSLQQRTADGRDVAMPIAPQDVSFNVVEYRPVYLSGDVAKPGEQPFRPGMIARHAIAVAGGYDVARFRLANPFLEGPELRAQLEGLSAEYDRDQSTIWRIQSELNPGARGAEAPVAPAAKVVMEIETDQLNARNSFYKEEKASLTRTIDQIGATLKVLSEQKKQEEEGVALDATDFERTQAQLQRGIGTVARVTDARRASLLSATRLLQTTVQIQQLEKQREDVKRQLQQLDDKRRMDLLQELQDANTRVTATRAKMQAVMEKMAYTGVLKSQATRASTAPPQIVVFRGNGDKREKLDVNEDEPLLPGDAVEITLKAEPWLGVPVQ